MAMNNTRILTPRSIAARLELVWDSRLANTKPVSRRTTVSPGPKDMDNLYGVRTEVQYNRALGHRDQLLSVGVCPHLCRTIFIASSCSGPVGKVRRSEQAQRPSGSVLMALTLSGFWRQVGCMDRRQIGGLRPVSPNDFLQGLFKVTMPLRHIYIHHIICC